MRRRRGVSRSRRHSTWAKQASSQLTVHFLECLDKVLAFLEANKAVAFALLRLGIADDARLDQRSIVAKGLAQVVVLDLGRQISTEDPVVVWNAGAEYR